MPLGLVAAGEATTSASEVVNIVKEVMGLFSEYPLNILLVSCLAIIGFKVFRSAKSSAA